MDEVVDEVGQIEVILPYDEPELSDTIDDEMDDLVLDNILDEVDDELVQFDEPLYLVVRQEIEVFDQKIQYLEAPFTMLDEEVVQLITVAVLLEQDEQEVDEIEVVDELETTEQIDQDEDDEVLEVVQLAETEAPEQSSSLMYETQQPQAEP